MLRVHDDMATVGNGDELECEDQENDLAIDGVHRVSPKPSASISPTLGRVKEKKCQYAASASSSRSVTNMWPGAWVIMSGGLAFIATA